MDRFAWTEPAGFADNLGAGTESQLEVKGYSSVLSLGGQVPGGYSAGSQVLGLGPGRAIRERDDEDLSTLPISDLVKRSTHLHQGSG